MKIPKPCPVRTKRGRTATSSSSSSASSSASSKPKSQQLLLLGAGSTRTTAAECRSDGASGTVSGDRALTHTSAGVAVEVLSESISARNAKSAATYMIRPGDVEATTMRAWSEGMRDGDHLDKASFEELMFVLASLRAVAFKLPTSSFQAADCIIVRMKLKAGFRPSELCQAIVGSMKEPWARNNSITLACIFSVNNLDKYLSMALNGDAPKADKDEAARVYLETRKLFEDACPWDAKYKLAFEPSYKTVAEMEVEVEDMRALIKASSAPAKPNRLRGKTP